MEIPRVQAHGPGFSKILLGDDVVDDWERHVDLMAESIYKNSGRGCINCSGVWASRHTQEIAEALAERLGPIEALPPDDPKAGLAAFTVPGVGDAVWQQIENDLQEDGVTHTTADYGPTTGRPRTLQLPPPDDRPLQFGRLRNRSQGVHVPVRDGRRHAHRKKCSKKSAPRSSAP